MTTMPGLHAPLPVGWTAAASGKLADGTMESYLVTATSLQKYGDVSGKPVPLSMVAQIATTTMLKMFAHSKIISSTKVLGCGRTPLSYLIERFAQKNGQLIMVAYGRPRAMAQPDPVAQTALDALCPSSSVASIQAP